MSAAELLPAVRQLFSEHPVVQRFSPEQVAGALVLTGLAWEMPNAYEVGAALEALDVERGEAA